jgi:T4 RnlA family RNA ligase
MFVLSEALEAIAGHDEIAIKRHDGLTTLDYMLCFPGTFDASPEEITLHGEIKARRYALVRQNCRGMKFDEATGLLVSLPLHKFFNIGQTERTQFRHLEGCKAKIYEKMDGSMIHFFVHPGHNELQASTRSSSQTSQAVEALALAKKNPLVLDRILAMISDGWTPIFEYVAAHNQIVVQYPRARLVYLISRNRTTGEYRFFDGMPDSASYFEFPFSEINNYLDRQEFEGYVCHLEFTEDVPAVAVKGQTEIVKAKTPWYLERHRAVDALMRPAYKLYQVVFDGIMDDLLPTAPDRFKPKLTSIYEEAQRDLLNEQRRVEQLFNKCLAAVAPSGAELPGRKVDKVLRKAFVEYVQQHHKSEFHLAMSLYLGNDPSPYIKDRLMEGYKVKYPTRLFADMEEEG